VDKTLIKQKATEVKTNTDKELFLKNSIKEVSISTEIEMISTHHSPIKVYEKPTLKLKKIKSAINHRSKRK
jgi:hypothetical protein